MAEVGVLRSRLETAAHHSHYFNFNASFDPLALIVSYENHGRTAQPGLLTNFLGVRVDPGLFGDVLPNAAGTVEPLPIPGNWHADIAEWGSALLSVEKAAGTYRIVELGCGWGCWMNNMGAAAKSRGLRVELIGIEADAQHLSSALSTLSMNGFQPDEYRVVHGIAAPTAGTALFPIVNNPGGSWGEAPILNATDDQIEEAARSGDYAVLKAIPLSELVNGEEIDLLHIDIQGGEVDFVEKNLSDITKYVRRILIGTHSRSIEGRLVDLLAPPRWKMEMDRPAIVNLHGDRPIDMVDGVHLYVNKALAAGA